MTRKQAFKEIVRASRSLADLCEHPKNSKAWWAQYGAAFGEIYELVQIAEPSYEAHRLAASTAIAKTVHATV